MGNNFYWFDIQLIHHHSKNISEYNIKFIYDSFEEKKFSLIIDLKFSRENNNKYFRVS